MKFHRLWFLFFRRRQSILYFQNLKEVLAQKVVKEQKRVSAFRKEFGNVKIGEVTVDQVRCSLDSDQESSDPKFISCRPMEECVQLKPSSVRLPSWIQKRESASVDTPYQIVRNFCLKKEGKSRFPKESGGCWSLVIFPTKNRSDSFS